MWILDITIFLSARATNPKPRGIRSDNRGGHDPRLVTSSPTIRCNEITELVAKSPVSLPRINARTALLDQPLDRKGGTESI